MAGHGVRAGLTSAVLRILIGNLRRRNELGSFLSDLNGILHDCIRPKHGNLYATLFIMTIDSSGNAVYCSAAQPPILLRRADGTIEELEPIDRPVGLFSGTKYREEKIRLEREDCLLLYTDGLVEATGWDNEPFGRERLRKLLAEKTAARISTSWKTMSLSWPSVYETLSSSGGVVAALRGAQPASALPAENRRSLHPSDPFRRIPW